jgi:hypothetical protein
MSPQTITAEPRLLARHPQRPWRRVESAPRRPSHAVARTYAAAVVRELEPRRERREPLGTW